MAIILKQYFMVKKPILKFPSCLKAIKISCFVLILLVLPGCGEAHRFEDFTFTGSEGKTGETFYRDSKACEAEKNKHSNKIQGREFGFKGQNVGYFGCMKLKGWERKEPRLY